MKQKQAWTKSGWRSLLHRAYPKCVVRFGGKTATLKLLCNEREFVTKEKAEGRDPGETLLSLRKHAEKVWKDLPLDERNG